MSSWTFLTSHAQVLLCVAGNPRVTAREIAVQADRVITLRDGKITAGAGHG